MLSPHALCFPCCERSIKADLAGASFVLTCVAFVHMQVGCGFPCARSVFLTSSLPASPPDRFTTTQKHHHSYSSLRCSVERVSIHFSIRHITTLSAMPPRNSHKLPLQPRHNRPNAPARVNDGLAAKQRGGDHVDTWRFAKNMTIKDPSQTIMAIGRATNTHITFDGKFEFRLWGSPDNVCCS